MLSRQFRYLLSIVAAFVVIFVLLRLQGYDLDGQRIIAAQSQIQGKPESDKSSSVTGTGTDQTHSDNAHESLPPSATAQDDSALHLTPDTEDTLPFQEDGIDWGRYAYVQYVTDAEYLCNSAMIFASLHKLGSRADRVLMYPKYMLDDPTMEEAKGRSKKLLIKLRDEYDVKLTPIQVQHRENKETTWADSYTKLLAFNQTTYDRVIAFDSDALVLKSMDELFFMPRCPIAMPRAYWLWNEPPPKRILNTQLMLLEPNDAEFARLQKLVDNAKDDEFDMELVNKLYRDSAAVLPHRPYVLLSGEFRAKDHKLYLGSDVEKWDPQAALDEAKLVHFSDWPVEKPWRDVDDTEGLRRKHQPACKQSKPKSKEKDCRDREIWNSLYAEFRQRRNDTCGRW